MAHKCKNCGKPLEQKRFSSGVLESPSMMAKRKFCDRSCMAASMEGAIKVMNPHNSRRQSAKGAKGKCEICAVTARLQVHHQDQNPLNNEASNLRTLCASCHRRCHSPNFTATGEQRRPCKHCEMPSVKLGMCETHLSRFRRYGNPLAKKRKTASGWVLMLHDGKKWSPLP